MQANRSVLQCCLIAIEEGRVVKGGDSLGVCQQLESLVVGYERVQRF